MTRFLILALLLAPVAAHAAEPVCPPATVSEAKCFDVVGTLWLGDGVQLRQNHPHRLFTIAPALAGRDQTFNAPPDVRARIAADRVLAGRFDVCPLDASSNAATVTRVCIFGYLP